MEEDFQNLEGFTDLEKMSLTLTIGQCIHIYKEWIFLTGDVKDKVCLLLLEPSCCQCVM